MKLRIGTLQSLTIEKWDKVQQRALVTKHIPQYIQTILYDLNYPNPSTLHVEGTLVGTSQSNLAVLMQQLRAIVRSRKVVWIDSSDAYQGRLDLIRIFKLQGPTIDSNVGILTAKFAIDAQILPPWGTTQTNPWKQSGTYLRDLNNVGREYALNPLMNHCNFTITPQYFSWEFILDNQNAFTNATSVQEAACTSLGSGTPSPTNPIAVNGTINNVNPFGSMALDNSVYAENLGASLKGTKSSPTNLAWYSMCYDFGTSGIDLTQYDRFRLWFRCDQSGQTHYRSVIQDTSGKVRAWEISLPPANTWMNIEQNMNSYTVDNGLTISTVRYIGIEIETATSAPASINLWLDDIRVESGYINHCEDTSGWTAWSGSPTITNDTTIFKEGSASLKFSGTSSGIYLGAYYDLPISAWNLTSPTAYDFFLMWFRSDFGGNSTGEFNLYLGDATLTNYFEWKYTGLNANEWYRLVIPLRNPTLTNGSPNLNSIARIWFENQGTSNVSTNFWLDEIAVDVGKWVNLEMMMPDNIAQSGQTYPIQTQSWNGSAYIASWQQMWASAGPDSGSELLQACNTLYYLDGTQGSAVYGSNNVNWEQGFVPATINAIAYYLCHNNALTTNSIYQALWGTNNRWMLAIKMPPATSDSSSGNYPSNDISGVQALNKARLKIVIYYSNEDTTYMGI